MQNNYLSRLRFFLDDVWKKRLNSICNAIALVLIFSYSADANGFIGNDLQATTPGEDLWISAISSDAPTNSILGGEVNGNWVMQLQVNGTVSNSEGEVLGGVSVILKGTSNGTTTDEGGNYSINVPNNGTLVFSSVGFLPQEVEVNNRSVINLVLENDVTSLSQVVVTALGITRQEKSLTYAVNAISADEIDKAKEVNVVNAIQGKVAGVTITRNTNGLGGDSKVLIRGNRSITGNNQPLYIVDGVPLTSNIGMLNTDDIESMTVLKGASAAALYGSQGQNGAIIITTKSAKAGKMSMIYNGGITFDKPTLLPELQYEYGQGDGGNYVASSEHSWGPKAEGQMVELWDGTTVPLKGQPDRLKKFFRTGLTVTNSLTLSGGSDKIRSYFSYGNTRQLGLMRNNDLMRHNIDLKVEANPVKNLSIFTKVSYAYDKINNNLDSYTSNTGGFEALPSAYRTPVSIPIENIENYSYIDPTGKERQNYWKPGSSILSNPYWALNRMTTMSKRDRIIGLAQIKYDFTDWISAQVRGSVDRTIRNGDFKVWADNYQSLVGSSYNINSLINTGTNLDGLVTINRDLFEDFNMFLNLGGSIQTGSYETVTGEANGLYRDNFFVMDNAKNPFFHTAEGKAPLVQSLYASATFGFKNLLFLDASVRNDWSSALPEANRSYFYPSIGLSGIISDMIDLPSWISYGKARVSFANSGFGGTEYLDRNYYTVGAGGQIITPTIQSLGDYKPELTTSYEIGLNWQFFKNRFGFDVTYYDTRTKNQLLLIGAPPASMFDQKYINAGLIKNSGVELELNFVPMRTSDFRWTSFLTFAANKNRVVRLTSEINSVVMNSEDDPRARVTAIVGHSFGDLYVKGWQKDDQGRRLVDDTGAPILTDGTNLLLGNYNPDFMMGLNNTMTYKNFTLGFLFDYRKGGYIVSLTQSLIDAGGYSKASLLGREGGIVLDAYTTDGRKNTNAIESEKYFSMIGDRYPTGEIYGYSRTNIRLREASLSYSIPHTVLGSNAVFQDVTVSLVGRNLFFLKRNAPLDPDLTSGINGDGLESNALPSTRSFGFNVVLTF